MNMLQPGNITRHTGVATETVISSKPCVLLALLPESTTTGTVTVRDSATAAGSTAVHVAAIGLTQAGKQFGPTGVRFPNGLTVQNSVAGDVVGVVWAPY